MEKRPILSIDLIICNSQGQILLGKVSEKWQEGGKYLWGLPGREVSFGESLKVSAERNVRDEVDMEMISGKVVCINSNFGYGNHYVAVGILVEAKGSPVNKHPNDWYEWKWFDENDIPSNLFPSAKLTLVAFFENRMSHDFE